MDDSFSYFVVSYYGGWADTMKLIKLAVALTMLLVSYEAGRYQASSKVYLSIPDPTNIWFFQAGFPPTMYVGDDHYVKIRRNEGPFTVRCISVTPWSIEPNYDTPDCWKRKAERIR